MGDFIIDMLNKIILLLGNVLTFVINLLPSSPFNFLLGIETGWFPNLNWFFPITEIVATLELWIGAIAIYYLIMIPLRWIKLIE